MDQTCVTDYLDDTGGESIRRTPSQAFATEFQTMKQTYVTDITHYLDETGELAQMPGPARKLASFLVLLIDATSQVCPVEDHDTRIRCRTDACTGSIRTSLTSMDQEISWYCPDCGHNGVIRHWQGTKWNQAER